MHDPSTGIVTSVFCVYYCIDPLFDCKQYSICRHPSLLFLKTRNSSGQKKGPLSVNLNIYHFFLSKFRGLMQSNHRNSTCSN